jgi:uncharacterized protein involved in exopolysaccharide biosynthesis
MSATDPTIGGPLTLLELIAILKARRRSILWVSVFVAALAGAWQIITPREYRASVLVSIASDDRGRLGALSSIASQLGPLASLAGAAGIGGPQKSEPLAVLKSRFLAQKFILENNVLEIFYTPTSVRQKFLQALGLRKKPTIGKATDYFIEKISRVALDAKTGLITLSVTWRDPKLAALWANGMIELTNRYLRDKAIAESQRHIEYLTDQALKTSLVDLRTAVSSLIENEVKQSMLARGNDEFALVIIDPAVIPDEPSSPGFALCLLAGALAGFALSVFAIYLLATVKRG